MKPQTASLKSICTRIALAITLLGGQVQAAPKEQLTQTLKRTVDSGLSLQAQLSKNQYRTESYQESYEVQVPYQATEVYYVDVPYQETETYFEQVPYQDTETYYVDVPYQEQEAYTDYEQRCESVRKCQNVPEEICNYEQRCHSVPDRQCRQEKVCTPIPGEQKCREVTECGVNALGQEICKTRKVCENTPGSESCGYVDKCVDTTKQECRQERVCRTEYREQCHYENDCRQVPVTKYRTVTKYRQEPRTQTVTKYREELRTRVVTKYRQEERTKTVTKYKTETKCCVTKNREVFDHQDQVAVTLRFPQGSELQGKEAESFKVALSGSSQNLKVDFSILQTVLGYKVANQNLQGAQATIDLVLAPKYTAEELGTSTVSGVDLVQTQAGPQVVLIDKGQKPRVQSSYSVQVRLKQTNAIVGEGTGVSSGSEKVILPLIQSQLINDETYLIDVRIQRSGIVVPGLIDFVKNSEVKYGNLDAAVYGNPDLTDISLAGELANAVLKIQDLAPQHPELKTSYKIKLQRNSTTKPIVKRLLFEKVLTAEQLQMDSAGLAQITLKNLGVAANQIGHFKKGRVIFLTLTSIRESDRLNEGQAISVVKEKEIVVGL